MTERRGLRWGLIRFGFRLLYNEFAFAYDAVSWIVSLGAWRCWQTSALRHLPAQRPTDVLELAHGTGVVQEELLKAGYHAVGLDLSKQMGLITGARLRRLGQPSRLVRSRAEEIPFTARSFDVVVSTFPTDFILAGITLQEVWRVLRPGGRMIVVLNSILTDKRIDTTTLEWLYRVTGQDDGVIPNLQALFEPHGFTATLAQEICPHSAVQVIVAVKSV